ncbi:metallophosphoesterase family protein [Algoriphagus taiwanensis]|uniref:Calcineurin-like phosphoesterase domain-containing protein n=1 Tax=Algoriphagus taiwanensis TaxID=1445656 RepID=A0ABQ6Q6L1_9BACT|nr:hypothetical protein Ataiwa_29000 [Algoriphagus taiwanensis]
MKRSDSRRKFLQTLTWSSLALSLPSLTFSQTQTKKKIKIGLISDLHQDIVPDGEERLEAFLKKMKRDKVDALVQLGDFAVPSAKNQGLIERFNKAHSEVFHVLGNHDVDYGYSFDQCVKAYGMPSRYYSRNLGGIKVIVLDGNEEGSPNPTQGYPAYIGAAQQEWLKKELEEAIVPVMILCHQPLAGIYPLDNALEMQDLLGKYSEKILLAINGHAHVDQHLEIQGVHYVHINSASYYWVGENLAHFSYPEEVHAQFPQLDKTCPYSESLFALLTIDLEKGLISLEGKKAEWLGPSPQELGISYLTEAQKRENLIPEIKDRVIH